MVYGEGYSYENTEDKVHVQRVIENVVFVSNSLDICIFLSPEGEEDVLEPVSDTELVLQVLSVMDAVSAVNHENFIEPALPSIVDHVVRTTVLIGPSGLLRALSLRLISTCFFFYFRCVITHILRLFW